MPVPVWVYVPVPVPVWVGVVVPVRAVVVVGNLESEEREVVPRACGDRKEDIVNGVVPLTLLPLLLAAGEEGRDVYPAVLYPNPVPLLYPKPVLLAKYGLGERGPAGADVVLVCPPREGLSLAPPSKNAIKSPARRPGGGSAVDSVAERACGDGETAPPPSTADRLSASECPLIGREPGSPELGLLFVLSSVRSVIVLSLLRSASILAVVVVVVVDIGPVPVLVVYGADEIVYDPDPLSVEYVGRLASDPESRDHSVSASSTSASSFSMFVSAASTSAVSSIESSSE